MDSRMWKYKECIFCGTSYVEKHHIFGRCNRTYSEQDGLWVWLCRHHHEEVHRGGELMDILHEEGQKKYEEELGSRADFMARYGKNYL